MDVLIELRLAVVDEQYRIKWNMGKLDYFNIYINGKLANKNLYRAGGFGVDFSDKYFMLLKYCESYYPDIITKDKSAKRHLEGRWCIFDVNGNEKIEFKVFSAPYLVNGSPIYSLDKSYYNIETGKLYYYSYSSMQSKVYLFLDGKDGVMMIDKRDGSYKMFS